MSADLETIFYPSSIAVIGASGASEKMGYHCLISLIEGEFLGNVYPINPNRAEILGLRSYPSVEAIPDKVDLAIIVVPANLVPSALKECGVKGIRGAVIITAGFKETGMESGLKLEEESIAIANHFGIKIIGPNTFGLVNPWANLNASFSPIMNHLIRGNIAVITQSGGVCNFIIHSMINQRIGVSLAMSLGNRANIEFADMVEYLAEHSPTKVIVLHIEGLETPQRLIEVAREAAAKKPIIVYKTAKEGLNQAAYSHTGALAGKYEFYQAAFSQSGMIQVGDCTELIDLSKALALQLVPNGNRVAVLSPQAGPGIIAAQTCQDCGLTLASFSPETKERIKKVTGNLLSKESPIDLGDVTAWEKRGEILEIIMDEENLDALLVSSVYHSLNVTLFELLIHLSQNGKIKKPIVVCRDSPMGIIDQQITDLEQNGIPVYPFPERAARALAGLVKYGRIKSTFSPPS